MMLGESIGKRSLSPGRKYLCILLPRNRETADWSSASQPKQGYGKEIPRVPSPTITARQPFVIFRFTLPSKDSRDARIKKKTPRTVSQGTLAWIELGKDSVVKIPHQVL